MMVERNGTRGQLVLVLNGCFGAFFVGQHHARAIIAVLCRWLIAILGSGRVTCDFGKVDVGR